MLARENIVEQRLIGSSYMRITRRRGRDANPNRTFNHGLSKVNTDRKRNQYSCCLVSFAARVVFQETRTLLKAITSPTSCGKPSSRRIQAPIHHGDPEYTKMH